MGFFNPQLSDQALATIDMMDFEGKEKVRETIRNNGTMFEQLQQMTQTATQLAQMLAATTGETRPLAALQQQAGMAPEGAAPAAAPSAAPVRSGGSTFEKAADKSREATAVK